MTKLRIAYWDDGEMFGGVEAHLIQILQHLDQTVFEPTLCCSPNEELVSAAASLGVPIRIIRPLRGKLDASYHLAVAAALREVRPHVLHAILIHSYASLSALVLAKRLGTRAVMVTSGNPTSGGDRLQELARRVAMRSVDLQIAPSAYIADTLAAMSQRLPGLVVVRNGVGPTQALPRSTAREKLGLSKGATVVGSALRLVAWKRVDILIDMARALPEVQVVVLGDGPERRRLEKLAHGTSMRFLGFRADAAQLLSAFDVFVHPTPTEPQGIVVLEAMAAGVPVVVADTGGTAESVEHERTGLLAPAAGEAFAAAVSQLLADPALADRLQGAAAEAARSRFSAAEMVGRLEHVYRDLAALRASPARLRDD